MQRTELGAAGNNGGNLHKPWGGTKHDILTVLTEILMLGEQTTVLIFLG